MRPPKHLSVALPFPLSSQRLDYDLFRQEPAITEFDWLFTPSPKSEEPFEWNLFRPPLLIRVASPCPGLGHPVSGQIHMTKALLAPLGFPTIFISPYRLTP